jgi:restriction endonuclease Mrr
MVFQKTPTKENRASEKESTLGRSLLHYLSRSSSSFFLPILVEILEATKGKKGEKKDKRER